jgi:ABC-type multidrug transport system fused ATPase/permease subunit
LARALYAKKDVYILDEPLSAVDAHVARWLFDRVIGPKGAMKESTRIIVTHRIQFASEADLIIIMNQGRVQEAGSYYGIEIDIKEKL